MYNSYLHFLSSYTLFSMIFLILFIMIFKNTDIYFMWDWQIYNLLRTAKYQGYNSFFFPGVPYHCILYVMVVYGWPLFNFYCLFLLSISLHPTILHWYGHFLLVCHTLTLHWNLLACHTVILSHFLAWLILSHLICYSDLYVFICLLSKG